MLPVFTSASGNSAVKARIDIEKVAKAKFPALPESAMRVSKLLRNENVSTKLLADAVRYDPILTVRILRLANSAFYSMRKGVTSVQHAIDVIGTKSLNNILLMDATANIFSKEINGSAVGRKIWEHSLATALLSAEICRFLKLPDVEEAFTCGLLHDIGKIMLLRVDAANYLDILTAQDEDEMLNQEREAFGYSHAQVGGLVARRWNLPAEICYAILNHHDASQSSESAVMAHVVNLADLTANVNGYGLRKEEETAFMFSESAVILRINEEDFKTIWETVQQSISEVLNAFES